MASKNVAFSEEIASIEASLGITINQKDENGDLHGYQFITYSGMGEHGQEHGFYKHGKKDGVWKWRDNNLGKGWIVFYKDGEDIGGLELMKEKWKNLTQGSGAFLQINDYVAKRKNDI
jgi:hypothetical protein